MKLPSVASWSVFVAGLLLAASGFAAEKAPSAEDADFFEKRIRPVLAEHCFECHGEKKQKGGLRLDSRAAVLAGGDIGPSIVLNNPEKSPLVTAIRYEDEELQMPPKKKLAASVVADFAEWVKRGAPWPGSKSGTIARSTEMQFTADMKSHWAFAPLSKPTVPTAAPNAHPVDAFLQEKLKGAGLSYAQPADKPTLLRRVTFDLTGLPPTPEELNAFVADSSPEAFSKVIERLLASPHYGERYGRHWLDVARYADTNGSEVDHAMANAWRYRDYVIRAFNEDIPFDQFAREQIAGDLMPNADSRSTSATGFLLLGPKALAELDKERLIADVVDEQVDTVGRAFMGLTLGCARCHDHKFDPVSAADYYAVAGIFKSTKILDTSKRVATWTEKPVQGINDATKASSLRSKVASLRSELNAVRKPVSQQAKPVRPGGALLVEAENFTRANVRVDNDDLGKGIGVIRTRLEYPDQIEYDFELPEGGEYQLELRYAAKESRPIHLLINGNLETMEGAAEVTGDWTAGKQKWFLQGIYRFKLGKNTMTFRREGPVPIFDKWMLGRPLPNEALYSAQGRAEPSAPGPDATTKQKIKQIEAAIATAEDELEKIPMQLAPVDGPVADMPIFTRGNPAMPGAIVPRGFLRVIHVASPAPPANQSGRLELAQWMTSPKHPLTARVIVNRVWQWHFGEGLVRSPDNFGLRGEAPSHPELLDWLATWFMENGWSLKKLHTLICSSAAYQQQSAPNAKAKAGADPENRLLSYFPRRRLDAEALRDAMLSAAGTLDPAKGGTLMAVMNRTYAAGGNAPPDIVKKMHYDSKRRSIYLPIVRNALYDLFAAFDYPDPGMLTGKRAQTTVAPQALFLMNSPFVREQANALAERVALVTDDDWARVRYAYNLVLGRTATDEEVQGAIKFLTADAAALKGKGVDEPWRSAWPRFCHALLASNEFLYLR